MEILLQRHIKIFCFSSRYRPFVEIPFCFYWLVHSQLNLILNQFFTTLKSSNQIIPVWIAIPIKVYTTVKHNQSKILNHILCYGHIRKKAFFGTKKNVQKRLQQFKLFAWYIQKKIVGKTFFFHVYDLLYSLNDSVLTYTYVHRYEFSKSICFDKHLLEQVVSFMK